MKDDHAKLSRSYCAIVTALNVYEDSVGYLLVSWKDAEICRMRLLFKFSSFLHFLLPVGVKTAAVCSSNPASRRSDTEM